MKGSTVLRQAGIGTAIAAALLQFGSAAPAVADEQLPAVVVNGKRASLMSAQESKRGRIEIVDSVVADEINKLPDVNVTDALQRVTGVQILRDRGEGAGVAIRGLTQMETTVNGRELFTAGAGRNLDFADLPAELLGGIDVYKTASADQLEGGIGGTIDLRTRRPFDFGGREIVASARLVRGDLVRASTPQFSLLASDRWRDAGGGQFGALLNVSLQKRAWREDQKSTSNPAARSDLLAGQTVFAPKGTSETSSVGDRDREAVSAALQWRPSAQLELYADGAYAQFRTLQQSYQINVAASPTFAAGSVSLFPGTQDVKSVTWTNAPLSILSFARDTVDRSRQAAVGGRWTDGALTLKADLSHTASYNNLFFSGPVLEGAAANFTQDLSSRVPGSAVSGTDLLTPGNLRYTSMAYRTRPFDGRLNALRLDGELQLRAHGIETLAAGVRIARRAAGNAPGLIVADTSVTGIAAADRPQSLVPNPASDFFPGEGIASIANYLTGSIAQARDAVALRNAFGITAALPAAADPRSVWDIREETRSAYLMATFKGGAMDGNAGLRVVHTRENVAGTQSLPSSAALAPVAVDSGYTDFLPSLNLRHLLDAGLVLRAAASRTITRPDFNQLSPSLTLLRNVISPSLNQGSTGNPDLKAVRANNLDLAVERYFSASTSLAATVFLKNVDGFVTTVSAPRSYDGVAYLISRPQNSNPARIKGAELGYQQFFDFLPGPWSGCGLQANYTYVDSATPNSTVGADVPLQNLSKHSANLVAIYEKERLSARLAYNWRDKFLSSVTSVVGLGALPIYTRGYGWLDASLALRLDGGLTIAVEGVNLLRTVRTAYYGLETRPQNAWVNDRQLSVTATLHL